jgi:siroheme synthase (precorrin-2 oxidase/ferrochelatase)
MKRKLRRYIKNMMSDFLIVGERERDRVMTMKKKSSIRLMWEDEDGREKAA